MVFTKMDTYNMKVAVLTLGHHVNWGLWGLPWCSQLSAYLRGHTSDDGCGDYLGEHTWDKNCGVYLGEITSGGGYGVYLQGDNTGVGRPPCRVDTHTPPVRMWPVEHSNDRWLHTVLCLWEQSVEYSVIFPLMSGLTVNVYHCIYGVIRN